MLQQDDYFSHLDVSLAVDEDVLRFEVSVDNVQVVEVLECQHYLGRIEPRVGLTERQREGGRGSGRKRERERDEEIKRVAEEKREGKRWGQCVTKHDMVRL